MDRAWTIHYSSREYAREMGDPTLGIVRAASKEQAEDKARAQGLGGLVGVWAVPAQCVGCTEDSGPQPECPACGDRCCA